MKKFKNPFSFIISLILISSLLLSCQKENKDELDTSENEVSFSISIPNLKSSSLKSAYLNNADKVIITIQNLDGSNTNYTSSEINIYQMSDNYFIQKILLKTGSYKLTEFTLIDSSGNSIFAAPLLGSKAAQNVTNPLPIEFDVSKNITQTINVEVLSTEEYLPEDFGFTSFKIIEIKTFNFMIGVTDKTSNDLLSAKLTVSNDSYTYIQNIDSIANNVIIVKDSLSEYTLTIEKSGYKTFVHSYSIDSLKLFSVGNFPLIIEIEKEEIYSDIVVDNDGNEYKTVKIGNQVWMAENLRTTTYNDGEAIQNITNSSWGIVLTGAYCWYNNDSTNANYSGALYNWYVANSNKICPIGWHVPTSEDMKELSDYLILNGFGYEGTGNEIAKSLAFDSGWYDSYISGTVGNDQVSNNSSGFSAHNAGYRHPDGSFRYLISDAYWWTSTEYSSTNAIYRAISYNRSDFVNANQSKNCGFSIRCIKD